MLFALQLKLQNSKLVRKGITQNNSVLILVFSNSDEKSKGATKMKYLLIGFLLVVKIFCVESCASKEASSESAETREHPQTDQSTPLASRK